MNNEQNKPLPQIKSAELRQYRAIAHKLNPVVRVAGNGLSPSVLTEVNRALDDHELIKIKIAVGDRDLRDSLIAQLCGTVSAGLVQRIGNTATLLRRNPEADPRKSNLQRPV
jgi:RNA-binding protein